MRSKLADNILQTVQNNKLFTEGDKIVVAVSGGIDSTALLHLLAELDFDLTLYAVYIDHQLRPDEVPTEISHVRNEAKRLGITFIHKSIDTLSYQKKHKLSQEEAARILRYNVLESIIDEYNAQYIAVGHTSDDQVEEFFLRLLRGSGKCGLSGMVLKQGLVIRPLLETSKDELRDYLENKNIGFCEDSSNKKLIYTRNRVRHDLLPLLETFNPSIRKTILNTSNILKEEDELLQSLSDEQYRRCVQLQDNESIDLTLLNFVPLSPALKRRVLEKICWNMESRPTYTIIENILLLTNSTSNKTLTLEGGLRVTKTQDKLQFYFPFGRNSANRKKTADRPDLQVTIEKEGSHHIPQLKHILQLESAKLHSVYQYLDLLAVDYDKVTFPLTIRYQRNGEKFQPINGTGKKKVNRFLTDKKISLKARNFHPLLLNEDDEIISVLGLTVADRFKITDETKKILTINWTKS